MSRDEGPLSGVLQYVPPSSKLHSAPLLFYSIFIISGAAAIHVLHAIYWLGQVLLGRRPLPSELLFTLSNAFLILGAILFLVDLFYLYPKKRSGKSVLLSPPASTDLTVVLTAYNDEQSIAMAVADFKKHPRVAQVIVVSNNSTDNTLIAAEKAGAIAINETAPGYGNCVYRCLKEGLRQSSTDLILLCEGDMTFRASDIDKFLAYIPHAAIVNGTRIVEQLRAEHTQLSTFMYYGNFFVGKLLEVKHLGRGTFTDVGTTYKLCRRDALNRLMPILNPAINLEFNAHFMDTALTAGELMVECPITFYPRIGKSKGGNVNNHRALAVGTRMIQGLLFGF